MDWLTTIFLGLLTTIIAAIGGRGIARLRRRLARRNQAIPMGLPSRTLSAKRVSIIQTGEAPFVNEVASLLSSGIRERMNAAGKEAVVRHLTIPADEAREDSTARIAQHMSQGAPDLVVTVGSTATVNTRAFIKTLPIAERPAQVFTAITRAFADGMLTQRGDADQRGNLCGVTFDISQAQRLEFFLSALDLRRIAFVSDGRVETDKYAYHSMLEYIADYRLALQIDFIEDDGQFESSDRIAAYDAVIGWFYLHEHIERYAAQSPVPVLGGGAIDARQGATLAIADDERSLSLATLDALIKPILLDRLKAYDARILSIGEVVDGYAPRVFASRESLRRLRLSLPPGVRARTTFFE